MLSTEKPILIRVLLRSLRSFGNGLEFLCKGHTLIHSRMAWLDLSEHVVYASGQGSPAMMISVRASINSKRAHSLRSRLVLSLPKRRTRFSSAGKIERCSREASQDSHKSKRRDKPCLFQRANKARSKISG